MNQMNQPSSTATTPTSDDHTIATPVRRLIWLGAIALGATAIGFGRGSLVLRCLFAVVGVAGVAISKFGRAAPPSVSEVARRVCWVSLVLSAGLAIGGVAAFGAHAVDANHCAAALSEMGWIDETEELNREARSKLRVVARHMSKAADACERGGMDEDAVALRAASQRYEALAMEGGAPASTRESRASRRDSRRSAASSLDPTKCPKGNVRINTSTGETVHCTGPADAESLPPWVETLAKLTVDPRSTKPTKVDARPEDEQESFDYTVEPFGNVTLIRAKADKREWSITFEAHTGSEIQSLAPSGGVTKICGPLALSQIVHYRVESGPFAGQFVTTTPANLREPAGKLTVRIASAEAFDYEIASAVKAGELATKPASIDEFLCGPER